MYIYFWDGKGNVDRIRLEWGRAKETYNYDPYGNLTYGIPDTVNYYGYNGELSNLATGLQYLRARYYNPQTGNFITEDTYAGQISNPLTLNRYDYVSNNPVNYVDPSGHSAIGDFFTGLGEAFQRGWDIQQKNQQYEQEVLSTLLLGDTDKDKGKGKNNGKNSDKGFDNKISPSANEIPKDDFDLGDAMVEAVSMQVTAQMERDIAIKDVQKKFCENLEEWKDKNVGNEVSEVLLKSIDDDRRGVFFVEVGEEMIYVIEEEEIEKFITSYTEFEYNTENKLSSGYKFTFGSTTIDVSATLRDFGVSIYKSGDTYTSGGGFKIDALEFQIGYETFQEWQKEDGIVRAYEYVGGDGLTAVELVTMLLIEYYISYYDIDRSMVPNNINGR